MFCPLTVQMTVIYFPLTYPMLAYRRSPCLKDGDVTTGLPSKIN